MAKTTAKDIEKEVDSYINEKDDRIDELIGRIKTFRGNSEEAFRFLVHTQVEMLELLKRNNGKSK